MERCKSILRGYEPKILFLWKPIRFRIDYIYSHVYKKKYLYLILLPHLVASSGETDAISQMGRLSPICNLYKRVTCHGAPRTLAHRRAPPQQPFGTGRRRTCCRFSHFRVWVTAGDAFADLWLVLNIHIRQMCLYVYWLMRALVRVYVCVHTYTHILIRT